MTFFCLSGGVEDLVCERRDLRVLEVLKVVVMSYLAKDFLMEDA